MKSFKPQSLIELAGRAGPFLDRNGFKSAVELTPLHGGANNRVCRVDDGSRRAVLKAYFQHATDPRDRFGAERAFYTWVAKQGIGRTPVAIAWDADERLGLLSFVEGRKLTASEIQPSTVQQALDFIRELNARKSEAEQIPAASESCFSLEQHLSCVDRRVERLHHTGIATQRGAEASQFVHGELEPAWKRLKLSIPQKCSLHGIDVQSSIPPSARCVSPSDFGFHNALMTENGVLRFFDFEYSGWDDPLKMICDFFCQPQVPVDLSHWDLFLTTTTALFPERQMIGHLAEWFLPVYRIKWCCIMLNEFVASDLARRDFAQFDSVSNDRKAAQLNLAREYLRRNTPQ